MHRHIRQISAAFAVVLLSITSAFAQPLADRLPADAIVYAGWAGIGNMGPDYKGSNLKAVLDASQFQSYVNEYLPKLADKIAEQKPEKAQLCKAFGAMASVMFKHPSAIAITDIKFDGNKPVPRLIVLCQAGNDAAAVKQALSTLINDSQTGPMSVRVVAADDLVALTVGYTASELVLVGPADDNAYRHDPLSKDDAFVHTFEHLQTSPAAVGYVNCDAIYKIVERQLNRGVDVKDPATATKEAQQWNKFSDALGLSGLHHVAFTAALDGPNWSSILFADAPAPRTGIVGLLDNGTVENDFLRVIPKSAAAAGAGRFDLGKVYSQVRTTLEKVSPESKTKFDAAMAQVPTLLGFDLKPDLLDTLGDQWAFYSDKSVGGSGVLGLALVNKVRDPDKLNETLGQIEKFLTTVMMAKQAASPLKVTLQEAKVGDLTIHYVAAPGIAPTWAIADGNLYFGLYPQVVVAAANQVSKRQPSIFENQGFIALQDRLKSKKFTGMEFLDLTQTAGDSYSSLLVSSRMIQGFEDMHGEISPVLVVPPLYAITPHLGPAGWFSYADASGWYVHGSSPFPGSEAFASSSFSCGPLSNLMIPAMMAHLHHHEKK